MSRLLVAQRALTVPGWAKDALWRSARAVPSLDLRFADNKSLVDAVTGASLITFTRASSGTYVGSDGVLRTAVTNLLPRSEEFDNASWVKTRVSASANATTAPNGTTTADALIEDTTASASHIAYQNVNLGVAFHTISVYAKASTRTQCYLRIDTAASTRIVIFDLTTGTPTNSPGIVGSATSVGNDWYRCTATLTAAETCINAVIGLALAGNAAYTGDGTSGIYLWGAQLEQSSTVGEYIPTTSTINSAPRFDHDPITGESLGLLVEEQRTNSITNNTMVGAVAGTPGTNPTNWFLTASANGISPEIVGTGVEDGITYIDIRYSGTSTGAGSVSILASLVTAITAATGQSWTGSAYVKLQAGSLSNLTNTLQSVNGRSAVGAGLESTNAIYTPTSDGLGVQRRTVSITLANASTARISHTIFNAAYASGVAIDFTIRMGLHQLEQGAFATSPILTSTAAATRSADVASITGTAFSGWYRQDEGTMFVQGSTSASASNPILFQVEDGTVNERIQIRRIGATNLAASIVNDGGVNQGGPSVGGFNADTIGKVGFSYALNNLQLAFNGALGTADTSATLPTVDRAFIGSASSPVYANGRISRLTYFPQALPSRLQAITQ